MIKIKMALELNKTVLMVGGIATAITAINGDMAGMITIPAILIWWLAITALYIRAGKLA